MQIDLGLVDALPTGPEEIDDQAMLESLPALRVLAYPREQRIAERMGAMIKLGRRGVRD